MVLLMPPPMSNYINHTSHTALHVSVPLSRVILHISSHYRIANFNIYSIASKVGYPIRFFFSWSLATQLYHIIVLLFFFLQKRFSLVSHITTLRGFNQHFSKRGWKLYGFPCKSSGLTLIQVLSYYLTHIDTSQFRIIKLISIITKYDIVSRQCYMR